MLTEIYVIKQFRVTQLDDVTQIVLFWLNPYCYHCSGSLQKYYKKFVTNIANIIETVSGNKPTTAVNIPVFSLI